MLFAALAAFGLLYSTQALLPSIGAELRGRPDGRQPDRVGRDRRARARDPAALLGGRVGGPGAGDARRAAGRLRCSRSSAAAAPYFWVLLVARGLVGVSLAAVVAVAVAHLGDEVHPAELGTAIGVYVAGNTLGGISGRLIPGLVEESSSWRAAVALLGVVALVAVAGVRPAAARRAGGRRPPRPARASTSPPCATCCATAASSGCACWRSC